MLEGLRIIFRRHGLDPFRLHEWSSEEENEEAGRRG
jgi:hypothetical protein